MRPNLFEPYTDEATGLKMCRSRQPTSDEKVQLENYLQCARECFGYSFSQATLCGSILQIAFMGIRLFSKNAEIPDSCSQIVEPQQKKAIPFCIGREIHQLPIGVIIYASRNQYNHLDDEQPHRITQSVFHALAYAHCNDPFLDLAFDLGNSLIDARVIARTVVTSLLGWNYYKDYHEDMKKLLQGSF